MRFVAVVFACAACSAAGCATVAKMAAPSNVRSWEPDQAVPAYAQFRGDKVVVHNVRNCRYFDKDAFVVSYEDRVYDMNHLRGVDFIVAPFQGIPHLAHTMLSFEFAPPDAPPQHLVVSVEIRRELGETYAAWKGSARQYELIYVLADERDVIQLRTNHRGEDVFVYRTTASPEHTRLLLVDVLTRVNELASNPEFYDTLTNNCTTNIVRHINRLEPERLKYGYRVLLPGYSDHLAYEEGLIEHHGTFEETKIRAWVNARALAAADREDFSQLIRR